MEWALWKWENATEIKSNSEYVLGVESICSVDAKHDAFVSPNVKRDLPVAKLSSKISICSSGKCSGESVGDWSPSQRMSCGSSRLSILVVVCFVLDGIKYTAIWYRWC